MSLSPRIQAISLFLLAVISATACTDRQLLPVAPVVTVAASGVLSPEEELGRAIFFDKNLSFHQDQACAACHSPAFGFTGPNPGTNAAGSVYKGSIRTRFGNRKPPSASYATFSPVLHYDAADDVWVGGNFWDGRATGEGLGNPAADQAIGPFLNPAEQDMPDPICVLYRIATGTYADLWLQAWGEDLRDLAYPAGLDKACRSEGEVTYPSELANSVQLNYGRVGLSVAAYEASAEVNAFSSKYDAYLAGEAQLTAEEQLGLELFEGKANCSACHPSDGAGALLTDFTYDNLGLPANPLNPVYETQPGFVDFGLGGFLGNAAFDGAIKVPTLRNVAKAPGNSPKAFGHNGVFKSLEQIVHFYNTRDAMRTCSPAEIVPTPTGLARIGYVPECWPPPEVASNINRDELGNLGLTPAEERAIVAFLRTLSDGWRR